MLWDPPFFGFENKKLDCNLGTKHALRLDMSDACSRKLEFRIIAWIGLVSNLWGFSRSIYRQAKNGPDMIQKYVLGE
jgi:hypothetical protein